MKLSKKIIIIMSCSIVIITVSVIIPIVFNPSHSEITYDMAKEDKTDETLEENNKVISDESTIEINEDEVTESEGIKDEDLNEETNLEESQESQENQETILSKEITQSDEIVVDEPTDEISESISEEVIESVDESNEDIINDGQVKDEWVQNEINENRDQIDDADLAVGAAIYNKIDTAYLFSLAEEGITDEEKEKVKAYLQSALSEDEYIVAMDLFNKYIGLVD